MAFIKKIILISVSVLLAIIIAAVLFISNIFYIGTGSLTYSLADGGYIMAYFVGSSRKGFRDAPKECKPLMAELNLRIDELFMKYYNRYPKVAKIDCIRTETENCEFSLRFIGNGTTVDGIVEEIDQTITVNAKPIKHGKSAIVTIS